MKHHSHKPKPDMTNRELVPPPPPAPPGRQEPGTEPFSFLNAFGKKKFSVDPMLLLLKYFIEQGYKGISFNNVSEDYIEISISKETRGVTYHTAIRVAPYFVKDVDEIVVGELIKEMEKSLNDKVEELTTRLNKR